MLVCERLYMLLDHFALLRLHIDLQDFTVKYRDVCKQMEKLLSISI